MDYNQLLQNLCLIDNKNYQTKQSIINILINYSSSLSVDYENKVNYLNPLTALIASEGDNEDLIELFLTNEKFNYSSILNKENSIQITPLSYAISSGRFNVVNLLLTSHKIKEKALLENDSFSAIKTAAINNKMEILKYLLKLPSYKSYDFNTEKGFNIFSLCAMHGHIDMLDFFLYGKKTQENFSLENTKNKVNFIVETFSIGKLDVLKYLIQQPLFIEKFIYPYTINILKNLNKTNTYDLIEILVVNCNLQLNNIQKDKIKLFLSEDIYKAMLYSIEKRDTYHLLHKNLPINDYDKKTIKI